VVDLLLGDLDAAVAGFDAARASAERLGARPWVVRARVGLAEARLRRGAPGDVDDARKTLAAAAAEAELLGMAGVLADIDRLAAPPTRRGRFVREGNIWTVELGGELVRLPDAKGLRDIRTLLARPGQDVSAVELLNPDGGDVVVATRRTGADPVLDDQARAAYRRRLDELDATIDAALARGDDAKAQRLDAERAALLTELRSATALGGRTRRLGDDAERARKAVTGRIRDVLRRLADDAPALAAHLDTAVVTGSYCRYDPAEPVDWET